MTLDDAARRGSVRLGFRIYNKLARSYYAGQSGIGPRFGAKRRDACVFLTEREATKVLCSHSFAFVGCKIERPGARCRP